jgi:NifU-like protein
MKFIVTIKRVVYPEQITRRLETRQVTSNDTAGNAVGAEARFSCGSFIKFSLSIDLENTRVAGAGITSNGCGYMLAAADVLLEFVENKRLADLHGLALPELAELIENSLGEIPDGRSECVDAGIRALRLAFADLRARQIEEFRGEKALICTCFGVTEEDLETHIAKNDLETVDAVALACNAGSGCGSCSALIQEILDSRHENRR